MHVLRGTESFEDTSGEVIYYLARCKKCRYIDCLSKTGQKCPFCGELLEEVRLSHRRMHVAREL